MSSANPDIERAVLAFSILAAGIGAILSPIPFADELVLVPVYGAMASKIAGALKLGLRQAPWKPIARATLTGLAARATINLAFGFIPGVAAVANGTSAAVLTRLLGAYYEAVCVDPIGTAPLRFKNVIDALRDMIRQARAKASAAATA